jgi:hypothetical protein
MANVWVIIDRLYVGMEKFRQNLNAAMRYPESDISKARNDPVFADAVDSILRLDLDASRSDLVYVPMKPEVAGLVVWHLNALCPPVKSLPPTPHCVLAWLMADDPRPIEHETKFLLVGALFQEYSRAVAMASDSAISEEMSNRFVCAADEIKAAALRLLGGGK